MSSYRVAAVCIAVVGILCGALLDSSTILKQVLAAFNSNVWSNAGGTINGLTLAAYHWLAAHPYPAVIGGMFLYMTLLLTFSHYSQRNKYKLQEDKLRQQYQAYQAFQHYRRLRQWEQKQQASGQQQQGQQPQAENKLDLKWGGMMGFGPQPLPDGCKGVVKEVLAAMDFYEVLGIAWNDVNLSRLKAARKARALAVHPDKEGGPGSDLAASRVNAAYETLSSSQSRLEYDAWLSKQF